LGNFQTSSVEVLNVQGYGAVGDGSTDDTAAIQKAFNDVQDAMTARRRGVTVYFPEGRYKITSTIAMPQCESISYADFGPAWNVIGHNATISTTSDIVMFEADGNGLDASKTAEFITPQLFGLHFQGDHNWLTNVRSTQCAIKWVNGARLTIQDCKFHRLLVGVETDFCINARILGCGFNLCSTGTKFTNGSTYPYVENTRYYMDDPEAIGIWGGSFHANTVIFEGYTCKYPIYCRDGSNHVLVDHMHFECLYGCYHLFRVGSVRDYGVEFRSVVCAEDNYLFLDASTIEVNSSVVIDGIQGVAPGIAPWKTATTYSAGQRVIEYESVGDVTADSGTDKFSLTSHGLAEGQKVLFRSTTSVPGGITADSVYFVRKPGANDFYVSTEPEGTYVNLTSAGSGTITVYSRGDVYYSLVSSNQGNTPSSSPSYWEHEGGGEVCKSAVDSASFSIFKGKANSVYKEWSPPWFWMNPQEWDVAGAQVLPRYISYEGWDTYRGGFCRVAASDRVITLPDGDTTPNVTGGAWYRTANTGATSISDLVLCSNRGRLELGVTIYVNDANTTFVDGAGFRLMGNANYAAAVGDILVFNTYDGATWVQTGGSH